MADNLNKKGPGLIERNYNEIRSRLERLVKGITEETEDKLLPKDSGDTLDGILGSLIRTFDKGENRSISEIVGKTGSDKLSDVIDATFNMDRYKDAILHNIMNASIDRIREQQYMIKNMPQINKVISAMVNAIMSPSTQSTDTSDIYVKHKEVTSTDIIELLKRKKFNEKERKAVTNGISYGAGFMMIYPYSEMAANILDFANVANNTNRVSNSNLLMASNSKKKMHEYLYGENNNKASEIKEETIGTDTIAEYFRKNTSHKEIDENNVTLIQESYNNGKEELYEESLLKYVSQRFYTESPISQEMIHGFSQELFGAENYYGEANRNVDKKKLKNLKGAYVKTLEEDKTIPVYINNELVGVYYVDYDTDFSDPALVRKQSNLNRFSHRQMSRLNQLTKMGLTADIKDAITKTIKTQLDERFLINNRHVLATIEKLVRDTRIDAIEEHFMIRWIPKKYLVEYANHDRVSQLANVEPLVLCWITLWRHYMMRKVFYEKDLRYVKYIVSESDDDYHDQGMKSLQAVRAMIPSPADIYNYRHMTMSIMNSNKIAIPQTPAGVAPFELATIPGQKPDDNIFDELTRLAAIITEEIGFSYNLLDPSTSVETATQLITSREDKAELILNKQIQFNTAKQEAIEKICMYEWGYNDLDLTAKFPELKVMKQNIFADLQDKLVAKIDMIVTQYYSDITDPAKLAYIRKTLFKYYISTVVDVNMLDNISADYDFVSAFNTNMPSDSGRETNE